MESIHTEPGQNVDDQQTSNIFAAEHDGIQTGSEPTYKTPVNHDIYMSAPQDPNSPSDLDLSHSIKGMYRILDLVSEQGSGGIGGIPFLFCTRDSDVIGSR